jgi:hypothetical protein
VLVFAAATAVRWLCSVFVVACAAAILGPLWPVASLLIVVVCYSCMQSSVDLLLAVEWLSIGGNNPGSWDETLLRRVYLALLLRSVDVVVYNIELDKL